MKAVLPLLFVFLLSCIGTDIIDDPIVGQSIIIDKSRIELLKGQSESIAVTYKDEYGIKKDVIPTWNSTNENVATINSQGIIQANNMGQSMITASYNGISSEVIMVTVVANEFSIARIEIVNPGISQLDIGDSIQLIANAFNINNEKIDTVSFNWSLDNSAVANIDQNGILVGISDGNAIIRASSSGVSSLGLSLDIGMSSSNTRTSTFMGANGYTAVGTAELTKNSNEEIILTLQNNFQTSFALGTFIYLANSTSGSAVRGSGLELGEISTNGMKTFNVSSISNNVDLDTYRYVIVLCKPASITFGIADFEN